MQEIGHYIGGRSVVGDSGRFADVFNPALGEVSGRVALAGPAEVDRAVAAATAAWRAWAATPPLAPRARHVPLPGAARARPARTRRHLTAEHGKVLSDAEGEVHRGMEVVEFACGIPQLLKGEFTEEVGTWRRRLSLRQPLGVVAGITPFNFPAMVPMWMFPVALACGNCFILKPSERDPSASPAARRTAEGGGAAGRRVQRGAWRQGGGGCLLAHPGIAAVSFVGSTPIARIHLPRRQRRTASACRRWAAQRTTWWSCPMRTWMQAADALMGAAYGSAGERCMAISVAVAVGDVGDRLVERARRRACGR